VVRGSGSSQVKTAVLSAAPDGQFGVDEAFIASSQSAYTRPGLLSCAISVGLKDEEIP
jgi:hypothetical protein